MKEIALSLGLKEDATMQEIQNAIELKNKSIETLEAKTKSLAKIKNDARRNKKEDGDGEDGDEGGYEACMDRMDDLEKKVGKIHDTMKTHMEKTEAIHKTTGDKLDKINNALEIKEATQNFQPFLNRFKKDTPAEILNSWITDFAANPELTKKKLEALPVIVNAKSPDLNIAADGKTYAPASVIMNKMADLRETYKIN